MTKEGYRLEAPLLRAAAERLRSLVRSLSMLSGSELEALGAELEAAERLDEAVAYAASVLRLAELWTGWAERCPSKEGLCREVEELVARHSGGKLGVVTFMNLELKRLLLRFYEDFSPGLIVPRWVAVHSARRGLPVIERLASLTPREQGARIPYFAATLRLLEARLARMTRSLEARGASVAAATAAYIYWEVLGPMLYTVAALERLSGTSPRPGEGPPRVELLKLYEAYREAFMKLVVKEAVRG